MSSKEVLKYQNQEKKEKLFKDARLRWIWNGVDYFAEFQKYPNEKIILTLSDGEKTQKFEIFRVKELKSFYFALKRAFKYLFPDRTFPGFEHPKFNSKLENTFNKLFSQPITSSVVATNKTSKDSISLPDVEDYWGNDEIKKANVNSEEYKINVMGNKGKYEISWRQNGKLHKVYLLGKESKFSAKSFVTLYYKKKWALRGRRMRIELNKDFGSFWQKFRSVIKNNWGFDIGEDFKKSLETEVWNKIIKAKVSKVNIKPSQAEVYFNRGEYIKVVSFRKIRNKIEIFIDKKPIDKINLGRGLNYFSIKLGKILDTNIGIPRENIRDIIIEIWSSWELENISYSPEFGGEVGFLDSKRFDKLKEIFNLSKEDLEKFKNNFEKFKESIENKDSLLQQAIKGIITYIMTLYAQKFNKRNIDLKFIQDNWPLIYHNFKVAIYYFAHLEGDFKNVTNNPQSSAKGYFQILVGDGYYNETGEWNPSSFQVAINRLYQIMSFLKQQDLHGYEAIKDLIGDDKYRSLMKTSRASPFPEEINSKLLKISPAGQAIISFINLLLKIASRGDFDLLSDLLLGKPEALLKAYLFYHHADPDTKTVRRAEMLSEFYFSYLKPIR